MPSEPQRPTAPPEYPNRFAVCCPVTGTISQHPSRIQAVIGYCDTLQRCRCNHGRPQLFEWIGEEWHLLDSAK